MTDAFLRSAEAKGHLCYKLEKMRLLENNGFSELTLFLPDLVTWRSYMGWFRPWPVGIGLESNIWLFYWKMWENIFTIFDDTNPRKNVRIASFLLFCFFQHLQNIFWYLLKDGLDKKLMKLKTCPIHKWQTISWSIGLFHKVSGEVASIAPTMDHGHPMKFWADVASKICFGRTYKFGIGIWFTAMQCKRFPHRASVVRGQRYTYRVLQTIQIKLILLCVWAFLAALKLL